MKSFFRFTVLTLALAFTMSCGKNEANCGASWAASVQDELNAVSAAVTAYSNDPTTPKCQSMVAAYQAYINAVEDLDSCVPTVDRNEWRQAIEDAKDSISNISC